MEVLSVSNYSEIWTLMILAGPLGVFLLIVAWEYFTSDDLIKATVCFVIGALILIGSADYCFKQEDRKELKVIIRNADEVDWDKYEVIGGEGKIVTLREK